MAGVRLGVREHEPGRGVVEYRYTLLNHRDEVVFTCRSINLVESAPADAG